MSTRQMIRSAASRLGSDKRQIFIAGFSAGGGMATAMMAAYPGVFAAGGVIAGMPVGSAHSAAGAMLHMRRANSLRSPRALADDVRAVTRTSTRKYLEPRVERGRACYVNCMRSACGNKAIPHIIIRITTCASSRSGNA